MAVVVSFLISFFVYVYTFKTELTLETKSNAMILLGLLIIVNLFGVVGTSVR